MKEKEELVKENQQPIYIMAQPNIQEDEIDLFELGVELWKKKIVIIAITAIVTIIAVIIVSIIPKTYEANAVIVASSKGDISELNINVDNINENYSIKDTFDLFNTKLNSNRVTRSVFDDMNLTKNLYLKNEKDINDTNECYELFKNTIKFTPAKISKEGDSELRSSISMKGKTPELISKIINNIIAKAMGFGKNELISNIQERIKSIIKEKELKLAEIRNNAKALRLDKILVLERKDNIEKKKIEDKITILRKTKIDEDKNEIARLEETDKIQIDSIKKEISVLRQMQHKNNNEEIIRLEEIDKIKTATLNESIYTLKIKAKQKKMDKLKTLQENYNIAKKLDIKTNYEYKLELINNNNGGGSSSSNSNNINTEMGENLLRPYMLGYKFLAEEILNLQNRKNIESFIPGLRDLEEQLKKLKTNERIVELRNRKENDAFIPSLIALKEQLGKLESNEKIVALKARKNNDAFIPNLLDLKEQLEKLKTNEKIVALKARKNIDNFIPELIPLQKQLALLANNRELQDLKTRKNDDADIPEIREIESNILKLINIKIDPNKIKLVKIDKPAYSPTKHIAPKKSLIVIVACFSGFILSCFCVLFLSFINNKKGGLTK